jgi:hypothetical protein
MMALFANYKKDIYEQSSGMEDFMSLLMKQRNNKGRWTNEDVEKIMARIKRLSESIPFLVVFCPFGILMLPVLASFLDRREAIRGDLKAEEAHS